jgi:uncharacterized protein YodC (DUF2158 family)
VIKHAIGISGCRDCSLAKRLLTGASVLALTCACATSEAMAAGGRFMSREQSANTPAMTLLPSAAEPGYPARQDAACLSPMGRTSSGTFFSDAPGNSVVFLNIGAGNAMTGASVDASVRALAPGRPPDSMIPFFSTVPDDPNGILFQLADTESSAAAEVSTGGIVRLSDGALPNVVAGADGMLRIEWFDRNSQANDPAKKPDVYWSQAAAPSVCQGIHLACTDQAACDIAAGASSTGMRTIAAGTMAIDKSALWMLAAGLGLFALLTRKQRLRDNKNSG